MFFSLPQHAVVTVPGEHHVHLDDPEVVAPLISDFLQTHLNLTTAQWTNKWVLTLTDTHTNIASQRSNSHNIVCVVFLLSYTKLCTNCVFSHHFTLIIVFVYDAFHLVSFLMHSFSFNSYFLCCRSHWSGPSLGCATINSNVLIFYSKKKQMTKCISKCTKFKISKVISNLIVRPNESKNKCVAYYVVFSKHITMSSNILFKWGKAFRTENVCKSSKLNKTVQIYNSRMLRVIILVWSWSQLLFMNLVLLQNELKMAVIKRDDILWQLFIM